MAQSKGSILGAMGWMFLLCLLLFWVPVVGVTVAGLIGGRKAGCVRAAIIAAALPSLVVGWSVFFLISTLGSWFILFAFQVVADLADVPAITRIGEFLADGTRAALLNVVPLLIGAILGGVIAQRAGRRESVIQEGGYGANER